MFGMRYAFLLLILLLVPGPTMPEEVSDDPGLLLSRNYSDDEFQPFPEGKRPIDFIVGRVLFYPSPNMNPTQENVRVFRDRFVHDARPGKPEYFRVVFETRHHLVLLVRENLSARDEETKPAHIDFAFYTLVRHHYDPYDMYRFSCIDLDGDMETLFKGPVKDIRKYYFASHCHDSHVVTESGDKLWGWNFTTLSVRDN